jgi:hypothetical protein
MFCLVIRTCLTPPCRFLHEWLTFPKPAEKFPVFYATRRFITLFTTAYPLSPYNPIQEFLSHFCKIKFKIFFHLRLGLASFLFPSCFPAQALHEFLFSLFHVMSWTATRTVDKHQLLADIGMWRSYNYYQPTMYERPEDIHWGRGGIPPCILNLSKKGADW